MGPLKSLSLVLLLTGFAAAQATTIGGYASNWAPPYGVYAAPFVPLVVTPEVSLEAVSPASVGASNATFGNVAGARNSTLEIMTPPPVGVYTVPVWYGPKPGAHHGAAMEIRHERGNRDRDARRDARTRGDARGTHAARGRGHRMVRERPECNPADGQRGTGEEGFADLH